MSLYPSLQTSISDNSSKKGGGGGNSFFFARVNDILLSTKTETDDFFNDAGGWAGLGSIKFTKLGSSTDKGNPTSLIARPLFTNVLQYPKNMPNNWHVFFKNNHPITLELACGKGEYSVGLGRVNPNNNYIGVDIKGNRIYNGAKISLQEGLTNVGFVRGQIDHLTEYFGEAEVNDIWIIFSDPFLRKPKNRLTHPRFLYIYQQVMKKGGVIKLKTDSKELYDFTLETIEEQGCSIVENIADIYGKGMAVGPLAIQTFYEKMHLADGRTIYYLSFTLPETTIVVPQRKAKLEIEDATEQ
jgi:tRNA (guanine-N7-)-methyltransferase